MSQDLLTPGVSQNTKSQPLNLIDRTAQIIST